MSVYGYARVSTKHQELDRQIANIKGAYGENVPIAKEKYSGTKTVERPVFKRLINKLKAGDVLVFDSISRMSRNASEGMQVYKELYERGVNIHFLKEPHLDTEVYRQALQKKIDSISTGDQATDKLMNTIIEALNDYQMELAGKQIEIAFISAEKEVVEKRKCISEGMQKRKEKNAEYELSGELDKIKPIGHHKGTKLNTKKSIEKKAEIMKHSKDFNGSLNDVECMKLTGLARNTFYRYKKELRLEA